MLDPRRVREELEEAQRTYGGRDWPATFRDRLTAPLPGYRDIARIMRQGGFGVKDLSDAVRIPVSPQEKLAEVHSGQAAITWIGHASYVVQTGGLTILADPVWSRKIPGVKPRLTPPGVPLAGVGHVDAVVISHNHYDHLDAPTIRQLPRDTPMLVPGMLGAWFRRRDFTRVIELDWWESVRLGDVEFTFVPAHHWSRRTLTDTCRTLWGGWVFTHGDAKVYFAGDTGYGHWFGEIAQRHPGIDLALLPVGAYEPNWFMKPVHMNPAEAVQACVDLGARRMATMHWGTFVLSAEPLLDPVRKAADAWTEAGRPREDLWDLAVGETRMM
jgi:L-ascorbate metabolism protein UlaG (beta-lactamase superfamily)